jgi:large subunit ribosomal protein L13
MDMNKAFFLRKEDVKPRWVLIDGAGKVVGRVATEIADILSGKKEVTYTPHATQENYVVVINAEKIEFTGNKMEGKEYVWYTGYRSGQKSATPREKMARDHEFVLRHAVKGMLRRNKVSNAEIKHLKIYAGAEHPHKGQIAAA